MEPFAVDQWLTSWDWEIKFPSSILAHSPYTVEKRGKLHFNHKIISCFANRPKMFTNSK